MPTVVLTRSASESELRELNAPRDDVVRERRGADGSFELDHGPFRHYRRTLEIGPTAVDGTAPVTQTIEFSLAIPVWGVLFTPMVKRELCRIRPPGRHAWWAPPERMDARGTTVLSLLCVISLFTGYLGTLLTQTNTFFKEEFGSSDAAIGVTLAVVRVGALLALGVVALADRRGRRRILIVATVAGCAATATGAFAPDLAWLGVSQTVARAFSTSMALIVSIIAVEETPPGSRAFAVSVLTATGALGAGIAVMLLWVADLGEAAWRILYVVPVIAIPATLVLGRSLPETRRFQASIAVTRDEPGTGSRARARRRALAGVERGRLLLLAASGLLFSLFVAPASGFLNEYLRTDRGFAAGGIIAFQILTNTPGGIGLVVGGRLADRHGRRIVGAIGLGAGVGFTVAMYLTSGWVIWLWSLLGAVLGAAAVPALAVYGPELFPTRSRGTANGVINLFAVVGSSIGLALAGLLADHVGGLGNAMAILALGPAVVVLMVVVLYPETTARELEDLNPADAPLARELLALDGLEVDVQPEQYPPHPGIGPS